MQEGELLGRLNLHGEEFSLETGVLDNHRECPDQAQEQNTNFWQC